MIKKVRRPMLGQRARRPSNDNDYRDSQAMSSIGGVLQDNFISGRMRSSLSRRTRIMQESQINHVVWKVFFFMETEVLFVEKKPRETTKHKSQSGIFFVLKKMRGEKRKMMEENRQQGKTYSLYKNLGMFG